MCWQEIPGGHEQLPRATAFPAWPTMGSGREHGLRGCKRLGSVLAPWQMHCALAYLHLHSLLCTVGCQLLLPRVLWGVKGIKSFAHNRNSANVEYTSLS